MLPICCGCPGVTLWLWGPGGEDKETGQRSSWFIYHSLFPFLQLQAAYSKTPRDLKGNSQTCVACTCWSCCNTAAGLTSTTLRNNTHGILFLLIYHERNVCRLIRHIKKGAETDTPIQTHPHTWRKRRDLSHHDGALSNTCWHVFLLAAELIFQ